MIGMSSYLGEECIVPIWPLRLDDRHQQRCTRTQRRRYEDYILRLHPGHESTGQEVEGNTDDHAWKDSDRCLKRRQSLHFLEAVYAVSQQA